MAAIVPTETVAFTITKDNWQQRSKMEELRLADSERGSLIDAYESDGSFVRYVQQKDDEDVPIVDNYEWLWGASEGADGSAGDTLGSNKPDQGYNAQSITFWGWLQSDIDYFRANGYVPDEKLTTLTGLINSSGSWAAGFASFEAFCEYCAGTLYESSSDYGFRRCATLDSNGTPVMTRGYAEPGDVLGYWLVEDLVLAYNHLTHCRFNAFDNVSRESWTKVGSDNMDGDIVIDIAALPVYEHPIDYTLNDDDREIAWVDNFLKLAIWDADEEYYVRYTIDIDQYKINVTEIIPDGSGGETETEVLSDLTSLEITLGVPEIEISDDFDSATTTATSIDFDDGATNTYSRDFPAGTGRAGAFLVWNDDADGFSGTISENLYGKSADIEGSTGETTFGYLETKVDYDGSATPPDREAEIQGTEFNFNIHSPLTITPKFAYAFRKTVSGSTSAPDGYVGSFAEPSANDGTSLDISTATKLKIGYTETDDTSETDTVQRLYAAFIGKGLFSNGIPDP